MDSYSKYSKQTHIAYDHFVEENGKIFAGHHYLIDFLLLLYYKPMLVFDMSELLVKT